MKKYTYDEALELSKQYFGNELSASTYLSKYALKDGDNNILEPTPDYLHDRLAHEFARIDDEKYGLNFKERYRVYRKSMDKFARIVPQGSPMAAIGNPYQLMSASNCVVIASPKDSMGGIMKCGEELAQLMKRRCGVGIDISSLRPEGARVNNAARTTSGAWSFADFYSYVTRMVGQQGRRGALMITISVHHPDVIQFATMKQDDTKVTGANVSIRLSDEFLRAVEADTEYEQRWPVEGEPVIKQMVKAKDVWNVIVKSATETADPGLIMWDNMINNLPANYYPQFKTISTNPCCFAKDSDVFVLTKNGVKEIKDIVPNELVWIDTEQTWGETSGYFNAGQAETFSVKLSNGEELFITNNHKLAVVNPKRVGSKISYKEYKLTELKNINVGDKIACSINAPRNIELGTSGSYEEGLLLGWLAGDGCLSYKSEDDTFPTMYLAFWQQEYDAAEKMLRIVNDMGYPLSLQSYIDNGNKVVRIASSEIVKDFTTKYETNLWKFRKGFNAFLFNTSRNFIKGYLNAYFAADGTVECADSQSRYSVQLSSIERSHLEQVKNLLLVFGIKSSIGLGRAAGKASFRGKEYDTKDCWRLSITGISNIKRFHDEIGCIADAKLNRLAEIIKESKGIEKGRDYVRVVAIESVGLKEVGCIEVKKHHKFTANGIISGNSEIALSAYDSCRLISINLTGYVRNAFKDSAHFDFDLYEKDITTAMQMADNLVDLELELVGKIMDRCEQGDEKELWSKLLKAGRDGRRTGLGTHGLADTLAQLRIKYDTNDAIGIVDKIYRTLRDVAYDTSCELAKVRGAFPVFNYKKEKDCPFIQRLPASIIDKIAQHGRRNISLLTQAPTGTVSIVSKVGEFNTFNISSGIEPIFRNAYTRRKKINANDSNARVDFTDQLGDQWQEYKIFHGNVQNYLTAMDLNEDAELPNYFVQSDEIDWSKRVELQGTEQQYIDHSISSTINFPENTPAEIVGNVYLNAWKHGLKGITVYVEGSREGVLISGKKSKRPKKIVQANAPKRGVELPCDIHMASVKGKKWIVLVGLLEGEPYEVFTGYAENLSIPSKCVSGKIIKTKKSKYDLHIESHEETIIIEDIIRTLDNPESAWATRMISISLRHGVPIDFIVEQLSKDGGIGDVNKAISRNLKKYIKEGAKVRTNVVCENILPNGIVCNSSSLVYSEGCQKCMECGYTKCG